MKETTKGMKLNRWEAQNQQQQCEAVGELKDEGNIVDRIARSLRKHYGVKLRDTFTYVCIQIVYW